MGESGKHGKEDGQPVNPRERNMKCMKVTATSSAVNRIVEEKTTYAEEPKRRRSDDTMWKHPDATSTTSRDTGSVTGT